MWGILSVSWGCSVPWGESSLLSLQWIPRAPYGASYMYETHHLNNYHHNSKSIGTIWGFVWDPFKRCFWAASPRLSLQQISQVSYGTHLYKCFWAASTLSSLQQTSRVDRVELHMSPAWTSVWGSFHTIINRSDPSGIMQLHMGHTFQAAPVPSLLLWALRYPLGPHFVSCNN